MRAGWIFSRRADVIFFPATFLVALVFAFSPSLAPALAPEPGGGFSIWWLVVMLGVDVTHVFAGALRTWLEPSEWEPRRHGRLLRVVLPGGFVLGLLLVLVAEKFFWSTLAYLAILHFCRQQWGWVALSRRRAGESDAIGRAVDAFAVHAAFLVPLAWWHANPTPYGWFVPGDMFPVLPRGISPWLEGTFLASALCYFIFSCARWRAGFPLNPAKLGIVALTGATAWTGMVAFQRQEVFASLHLLCHGLPYLALVYAWGRGRFARDGTRSRVFPAPVFACAAAYYGTLLGVGVLWELSLDSFLRHPFPDLWEGGEFRPVTLLYLLGIPLLTLPQSAHFVLDGFFWKSGPRNDGLHGEIDAGLKAPDRQGT